MNVSKIKKIALLIAFFFSFIIGANADITISPLKHELTVEQGGEKVEIIKITNNDSRAITLYTSTEDFIAGDDTGKPKFLKASEQSHPELSLANWIKLTEGNITLAPKETREVKFRVNVPKTGEPGGHYGAIFFAPEATGGQISIVQRLGVLILIDVPGEVKIAGEFKDTQVGRLNEEQNFVENNNLDGMPVVFSTAFENTGNIHLKPRGKIEILDDRGVTLENIGKEPIVTPGGAFVGERQVNYIPFNPSDGNVLPNSTRKFESAWEGFGYPVVSEDGTKKIMFRNLTDYYAEEIGSKAMNLKPWQQIKTQKISKPFTANIYTYYEGKNKEKKELRTTKTFRVSYVETYVGLNTALVGGAGFIVLILVLYMFIIAPKNSAKKEEELRKKIMEEMNKNK
ncbi:MAG: DUF916 domain-containing protein [Candidatus Gracilibacteria bacterium]|nr:DUF916 domain-containing protein [Candidatus Gracilibacteria bacterium]